MAGGADIDVAEIRAKGLATAGLGNGGEIVSLYADRLDRVYPRGEYGGQEEKEEEGGRWEGSDVGSREEGGGDADAVVAGSDFEGVEPVEEGESGAAAVGEGGTSAKDPSEMRLSRRIARSGIASRREAER